MAEEEITKRKDRYGAAPQPNPLNFDREPGHSRNQRLEIIEKGRADSTWQREISMRLYQLSWNYPEEKFRTIATLTRGTDKNENSPALSVNWA